MTQDKMNQICRFCQYYGGCGYLRDGLQDKCDIILHGEEWYSLGWEDAVNKALEWLDENPPIRFDDVQNYVEQFRKAMEEEL